MAGRAERESPYQRHSVGFGIEGAAATFTLISLTTEHTAGLESSAFQQTNKLNKLITNR